METERERERELVVTRGAYCKVKTKLILGFSTQSIFFFIIGSSNLLQINECVLVLLKFCSAVLCTLHPP